MVKPGQPFRMNPVELFIFLGMTFIFFNSLHHLFFNWQDFNSVFNNAPNPTRTPASFTDLSSKKTLLNFEVPCDFTVQEQDTSASKIRFFGSLCASETFRTQIINETNQSNATVFIDQRGKKFSSDYIPLNSGKNMILLSFIQKDGKTFSKNLTIVRN